MAIVINGSGTVTGISVGGLPDGIVDAGTLATNSVDSAELIDGSIDTAHIAADQITSAILPAGSVLQVVQGTVGTEASTSSNSYQTIVSASITPSSTSSKIYVTAGTTAYFTTNAGSRNEWTIFRDSTNVATGTSSTSTLRTGTRNNAGDANKASVNVAWLDSPSSTSAITYAFKARNNDASAGTFYWCYDNSVAEITLMEIAG